MNEPTDPAGQQPPPYPGEQPPVYPGEEPPAYPGKAPDPGRPEPAPSPAAHPNGAKPSPGTEPPGPEPGPTALPDDELFARRRIHIAQRQRGADAAALGNLALHVPNFIASLIVVSLVSLFFGGMAWLLVVAWLASGLLVFHRPTEDLLARRLLGLRYPTSAEDAKLAPIWREVTARGGVEGRSYRLWIEDSQGLNAVAAAGHIVGVTGYAVHHLPPRHLAAVLAHELGHHVGGHSWSSLLGYWYALPGRLAWRLLRGVVGAVFAVAPGCGCVVAGLAVLFFGGMALVTIDQFYGLPLLVVAIPWLIAAVSRRAELRADRHAAALGFGPMLADVLTHTHEAETAARRQAHPAAGTRPWMPPATGPTPPYGTPGAPPPPPGHPHPQPTAAPHGPHMAPREGLLRRLLDSHPDHHTRIHHLRMYTEGHRR
ncbi:M48 family metalloprotease [Streptomyces sp. 184]|uniref:M48 family metalloprotease n=1 Tax=Streptomyces sp. 184 TaxID=1827526 RepID=UPI0038912A93